jgi:hypothetical protein
MLEFNDFDAPYPPRSLHGVSNWNRLSYCLYFLSKTGFSTFSDLETAFLPAFHHTTTINRLLSRLEELDLVVTEKVSLPVPPRYFSLRLIRLSVNGRSICDGLNFTPVMSDWDDLLLYHEKGAADQKLHTACVLYAAYLARQFNWKASAMPNITTEFTQARPDLLIYNARESYYVEVETETRRRKKYTKWREVAYMAALSGIPFGFCVPDVRKRNHLLEDCKKAAVSSWYTDFETLSGDYPGGFWMGYQKA